MSSFDLYTEQGKWRQWDRFFDKLIEDLKLTDVKQKSVLDIGCATGASTVGLAKRFGRVVGVDADRQLIDRARAAVSYFPTSEKPNYEHAEDLASWDAFGERFDVVFVSYTLAYLGDITTVLKQWATLLKPGGYLVILEITGLFSAHSPLGSRQPWFEKFDRDALKSFGYKSDAGIQMGDACLNVADLKRLVFEDWVDNELSFNGPLDPRTPVWQGWEERWKRLWPLMNQFGVEEGLHDAFFSCLSSPDHVCVKPCKLLICQRLLISPRIPSSSLIKKDSEPSKEIENFYPNESGGGDGD